MNFDELMEALRGDEPPETIYDDLSASYHNAMEGAESKIAESAAVIEALNSEIEKLKAQNFDLLMAAPKPEPESDDDGEDGGEETQEDRPQNDDDLFDYERED